MHSQKVVTPVLTGVTIFSNQPKTLDSGFCRNDAMLRCWAFRKIINIKAPVFSRRLNIDEMKDYRKIGQLKVTCRNDFLKKEFRVTGIVLLNSGKPSA
jgi:hypothetical protein